MAFRERLLLNDAKTSPFLSAITSHPVSSAERKAIIEQRVKENAAQAAYDSAHQALFKLAGWGNCTP